MSFMVERCFNGLIGYSVPSSKHQACPLSEAWKASERSGEGPTASCHEQFFSGPSGKDLLYNFSSSQCRVGCKMLDNAWGAEMPGKQTSSLTISWWSEASFNRANLLSTPAKICPNRNNLKMHSTIPSHPPNEETNTHPQIAFESCQKLQNCGMFWKENCHFYIHFGTLSFYGLMPTNVNSKVFGSA